MGDNATSLSAGTRWSRAERTGIYLVFVIFILCEFLSLFVRPVRMFLDAGGQVLLLAVAMLGVFRYIDEKLADLRHAPLRAESFSLAIHGLLNGRDLIERIDVFAHTSAKYYAFLRDSRVRVKHLRLLLCVPSDTEALIYPSDSASREGMLSDVHLRIQDWKRMKEEGRIESLEIRAYAFLPTIHFLLINDEGGMFGIFRPIPSGTGVTTGDSVVFSTRSEVGRALFSHLSAVWTAIQQGFSRESPVPGPPAAVSATPPPLSAEPAP